MAWREIADKSHNLLKFLIGKRTAKCLVPGRHLGLSFLSVQLSLLNKQRRLNSAANM
jgi:hypothetical protein